MKIIYGMIEFILILSSQMVNATTYGGHLGPISIQMPFMKTNSNATITMRYTEYYPHNYTMDTKFVIYDDKLQNLESLTLDDLTIQAEPKSINLLENNTVKYTVVAKNNIKGVYGMSFSSCGKYPLVIGLNESEIMPSTLFRWSLPTHCGVIPSDAPIIEMGNYSGIVLKNVTRTQDQFSPIEQIQLGSNSTDVQCKQGFDLILKTHDNMPACVKSETAKILSDHGWVIVSNLSLTNNMSENVCGKFFTAPRNQTSFNTVPVLLMTQNSTACAKLTFTIISDYKNCNAQSCQHLLEFNSTLPIGSLHYEKHGSMISVSAGKDYTNSFKITTIPETIDLQNYPIGTNFTVTYIIRPLPNATGFYDQSIPKLACERYPLAVGHAADQVNASDFSYIDPLNPPCVAGSYVLTGVEISGMNYKEVTLRLSTLG